MELAVIAAIALIGLWFVSSTFKVLSNWERAVVLRLGKFNKMTGPGPIFLLPFGMDRAYRVDTRIITMDVPRQEMMTRDNVPVSVDAIVLFNVADPRAAVLNVENYIRTASLIAQTTLRSTVGQAELDDLLSNRERINEHLQRVIDEQTEPFGIKVVGVEIRDVSLPETMKRAMAAQAEAEREKRAKVINAEGEFLAAERLTQAAAMMSKEPASLQLRYLQSMREIASERSTMTIFPIPMDIVTPFVEMARRSNESARREEERQEASDAAAPPPAVTPAPPSPTAITDGGASPALPAFDTTPAYPASEAPRS